MHATIIDLAKDAAIAAGEITQSYFRNVEIREKAINNLVTQADIDAQKEIVRHIHSLFPTDEILGEESDHTAALDAPRLWIIDPLDGTGNYAHGIPHYCISIAFAAQGRVEAGVVYDPVRREMFHAARGEGAFCNGEKIEVSHLTDLQRALIATGFYYDRGELMEKTLSVLGRLFRATIQDIRRTGSAALDLWWVAAGRLDAYFEYRLSPWDFAAGMLIAREAGGRVVDRYGQECRIDSQGVVASTEEIMDNLLEHVRWID